MTQSCHIPGCDRSAKSRGMCHTHYSRWWTHGDAQAHVPLKAREPMPRVECTIDGCEKNQRGHGLCATHYTRNRRYGSPHATKKLANGTVAEFLRSLVGHSGDDCIEWPFCLDKTGYGLANLHGKQMIASRAMCVLAHGHPPESRYHAAHSCGNGHLGCVNPQHLRWATPSENMQDKKIHGTDSRGERSVVGLLTEKQVHIVRFLRDVVPGRELARRFGVHFATISAIYSGKNWAWLANVTRPNSPINPFRCDEVTALG